MLAGDGHQGNLMAAAGQHSGYMESSLIGAQVSVVMVQEEKMQSMLLTVKPASG